LRKVLTTIVQLKAIKPHYASVLTKLHELVYVMAISESMCCFAEKAGESRVYRIYKEEGLNLRSKRPKRRVSPAHRVQQSALSAVDQCWSMDFVADQLFNGRKIRALTVVDNFSRESLSITVNHSLKGGDVVAAMQHIYELTNRLPQRIKVDNGSEFISKALDKWAYENKVTLDFSRPGKPTDNAFIESFNGSFRDECLNIHWFMSLEDACEKIEAWRKDYNEFRPHSAINNLTPSEFSAYHQRSS
jgi:putative transposase